MHGLIMTGPLYESFELRTPTRAPMSQESLTCNGPASAVYESLNSAQGDVPAVARLVQSAFLLNRALRKETGGLGCYVHICRDDKGDVFAIVHLDSVQATELTTYPWADYIVANALIRNSADFLLQKSFPIR